MFKFFKKVGILFLLVGLAVLIWGLSKKIPSKKLTTNTYSNGTEIEEYVNGEAYNYIIGAALTGGEISGAKAQKSIYISTGIILMTVGIAFLIRANPENLME